MSQIVSTDTEYTIVQKWPKQVIFSKANTENYTAKELLDKYMEEKGFKEIKEEQLGGSLVYSNGTEKENIEFSVNKNYSRWQWM